MYFKPSQYPSLKGMTKPEQIQVIGSALQQYNKWVGRRLILAFLILIVAFLPFPVFDTVRGELSWSTLVGYVLGGVVFWIYILWEINFPVYAAVSKHLSQDEAAVM